MFYIGVHIFHNPWRCKKRLRNTILIKTCSLPVTYFIAATYSVRAFLSGAFSDHYSEYYKIMSEQTSIINSIQSAAKCHFHRSAHTFHFVRFYADWILVYPRKLIKKLVPACMYRLDYFVIWICIGLSPWGLPISET